MRPVTRGDNPTAADFNNYRDAFHLLASRTGFYCSYCERPILANLAVEHIQAKSLPQYQRLIGSWNNFLLGCVNCNGTKKDRDVLLDRVFLPDRDNTFAVFEYTFDGRITPAVNLSAAHAQMAEGTLALTGLDKRASQIMDENGRLVAVDRVNQRKQAVLLAQRSWGRLQQHPTPAMQEQIVETALASGFFSIWMMIFAWDADMRRRFIEAFPGTARDCFDALTLPVSPRPDNGLDHAGKI